MNRAASMCGTVVAVMDDTYRYHWHVKISYDYFVEINVWKGATGNGGSST